MKKRKYARPFWKHMLFLCPLLVGSFTVFAGCVRENMRQEQTLTKAETEQEPQQPVTEEPQPSAAEEAQPPVTEEPQPSAAEEAQPPVMEEPVPAAKDTARPGKRTLYNLLLTAIEPLGHTMYVWGGGWNEEDTAAGEEARSIGESPRWKEFFEMQDSSYNYESTRYQIHDGLDCSGYVGWLIYNVFETGDGEPGYVEKATGMAEGFAKKGWGSYTPAGEVTDWKPGDIMSMKGHVWISLGMCEDKSVVLLHASPPGVILGGTSLPDGGRSEAAELAETYMRKCYPDWYAKYPECARGYFYLTDSGQMRWNRETLADEERVQEMTAEEVLRKLFD